MKRLLFVLPLLLIVGCSEVEGQQQLIQVVKTYKYGDVRSITSHKETRNRIEKVKYVEYSVNGRKKIEENYNDDGIKDGLWTEWNSNGEKWRESNYKNGGRDGLETTWYENGTKNKEKTYKDGKLISKKEWNKDGSVKE